MVSTILRDKDNKQRGYDVLSEGVLVGTILTHKDKNRFAEYYAPSYVWNTISKGGYIVGGEFMFYLSRQEVTGFIRHFRKA